MLWVPVFTGCKWPVSLLPAMLHLCLMLLQEGHQQRTDFVGVLPLHEVTINVQVLIPASQDPIPNRIGGPHIGHALAGPRAQCATGQMLEWC